MITMCIIIESVLKDFHFIIHDCQSHYVMYETDDIVYSCF